MDTTEAKALGLRIFDEQNLNGWRFKFDTAKKRFGVCSHARRTISLSRALVLLNGREAVEDTIRHEVAHATVGPGHGHDAAWKAECRRVGAKPVRCYSGDDVVRAPTPWTFTCAEGCNGGRFRRPDPRRTWYCKRHRALVTWKAGV
jgi:predicted SprT family Zn-dependent metalloprotease